MLKRYEELAACRICPHECCANRHRQPGFCGASADIKINLSQLHYGEEPVLSGSKGSGTIFFSHCNLLCLFCQNYSISHLGWGKTYSEDEIIAEMFDLQRQGAHNINLVTPTHYSLQLADILLQVKERDLKIPIVWNSSAYEKVDILNKLDGLVDVYLPDLKFAEKGMSKLYSHVADYPDIARQAILEMHHQVGDLVCDKNGIARKGLIIRLLVMPGNVSGTVSSLQWISANLGNSTCISLMAQYYPAGEAFRHPEINRGITAREYKLALDALEELGFTNGFTQELTCSDEWTPDFTKTDTD